MLQGHCPLTPKDTASGSQTPLTRDPRDHSLKISTVTGTLRCLEPHIYIKKALRAFCPLTRPRPQGLGDSGSPGCTPQGLLYPSVFLLPPSLPSPSFFFFIISSLIPIPPPPSSPCLPLSFPHLHCLWGHHDRSSLDFQILYSLPFLDLKKLSSF